MVEISVIIPVYRESRLLPKILDKLLNQKINSKLYEIIVIIDEPTKYSLELAKKYSKKVKFILNKKRVGKAIALNKAVKHSSGRILLFLDSDILLPEDKNYLKKVIEEMKDTDILDIKKEVIKDSFLSRMTCYEYIGFNIGSWFLSKFARKCLSVNGSAFAMRRKVFTSLKGFRRVVAEDLDIVIRAFIKNYKFKYTKRVKVCNSVHSNWKNWFMQRKRWAIGCGLFLKEWYRDLLKACVKQPQIFIPFLFFLNPSLILILLYLFVPNLLVYKILSLIFLFLAVKLNFVLPVLWLSTLGVDFIKNSLASLLSFLSFSTVFFTLSKKLDFNFKFHEFLIYYFFYSLLNLFITIIGIITALLFEKKALKIISDWKI